MANNKFINKYEGSMDSKYFIPHYALSAPTSIQTANQLKEATDRLNAGVLGVELQPIQQEHFQSIPKDHLKEINRLSILTGAEISLHAPIIDPAGFSRERWSEWQRKQNEQEIIDALERAEKLNGQNIPVVLHGGTAIGDVYKKVTEEELRDLPDFEQKRIRDNNMERKEFMGVVNQDTGQLNTFEYEVRDEIGGTKKIWDPDKRLENLNRTTWDKELLDLFTLKKQKDEVNDRINNILVSRQEGKITEGEFQEELQISGHHINEINQNILSGLDEVNNKFKKFYDIDKLTPRQKRVIEEIDKTDLRKIDVLQLDSTVDNLLSNMSQLPTPKVWTSAQELAQKKTTETISNAVLEAYNQFGDRAPTMVLENWNPEFTMGRAKDLKRVIETSRQDFADKLVRDKGLSPGEAEKIANKLIGATWDVGHINLMRKFGYSEKDILEETKEIGKEVKHIHLTDNFGINDAHLAPGMGNVPIKEHIQLLKEKGFKFDKSNKGNVVVEAGKFAADFKENPHLYTLEALETPLYTFDALPNWYQIKDTEGPYGLGYGRLLPEKHFELYGAGFSNLPEWLGGQMPSTDRGRFAQGETQQDQEQRENNRTTLY